MKVKWNSELNLGHVLMVASFLCSTVYYGIGVKFRLDDDERTIRSHEVQLQKANETLQAVQTTQAKTSTILDELVFQFHNRQHSREYPVSMPNSK